MPRTSHSQGKTSILVVDDDPTLRLALAAVLEDLADIVLAGSGPETLRCLLAGDVAVILLDVHMPGMDGFETARLIRAHPRNRSTPILFVTGLEPTDEQVLRGYAAGAVDFLFKPVTPEILRAKVAVFLELASARRQLEDEIEVRKQREDEKEQLIARLEEALARALAGLLPVCAWCKKIRDEAGNWQPMEMFLTSRTLAQPTHGICPECHAREFGGEPDDE